MKREALGGEKTSLVARIWSFIAARPVFAFLRFTNDERRCTFFSSRATSPTPAKDFNRPLMKSIRPLLSLVCVGLLVGCATVSDSDTSSDASSPDEAQVAETTLTADEPNLLLVEPPREPIQLHPFSLEERMSVAGALEQPPPSDEPEAVYSFRSQDLPLADALALFARVNKLNIIVGPDVQGTVTVDFQRLPLEKAMAALLETHGYYWETREDLVMVRRLETRTFNVDYIRLERGGSGRNKAQVTSGSGGGQDAGEVTLSQQDTIKFWEELEEQIKTLLSADGRLVVNRLSGTIQVTDLHHRVEEVAKFLAGVRRSLYRQVEIEARIYEVALTSDYSLGIDWTKIQFAGTDGLITLANIIGTPAGGIAAKAVTSSISFSDGSFEFLIEALSEQGDVRIVSQPRLLTLNNQPALIKIGTDESFFTSTVTQGTAGTGNIVTEQVRTVTSGLVLSLTPQISDDGWIMIDVSPIITRITATRTSQNGSTAPVTEVKQSGGLVRMRDGEMVIIAGLIQDQVSETERKVPLLGDIPGLGRLFKGTYEAKTKSELVIFLSPKIVGAA